MEEAKKPELRMQVALPSIEGKQHEGIQWFVVGEDGMPFAASPVVPLMLLPEYAPKIITNAAQPPTAVEKKAALSVIKGER